jgi:hypothetical protein
MRDQSTTDTDPIRCEAGLADGLRSGDAGLSKSNSSVHLQVGGVF